MLRRFSQVSEASCVLSQGHKLRWFDGPMALRSDIRPPLIPPWWCILPPPVRVLRGLYWQGSAFCIKGRVSQHLQLQHVATASTASNWLSPCHCLCHALPPGYLDALLWFRTPPRQLEAFCGRREPHRDRVAAGDDVRWCPLLTFGILSAVQTDTPSRNL